MKTTSVTKFAGLNKPTRKKTIDLVGLVLEAREKSVKFQSEEMRSFGLPDIVFVPRSQIDQGDAIEVGDTEIRVTEWWIERRQEQEAEMQP